MAACPVERRVIRMCLFIAIFSIGVVALLLLTIVFVERKQGNLLQETKELRQQRNEKALADLEVAQAEWLSGLKLPVFEEQTRLQEAASQLSFVLIEKLMRQQYPGPHPKNHQQIRQS